MALRSIKYFGVRRRKRTCNPEHHELFVDDFIVMITEACNICRYVCGVLVSNNVEGRNRMIVNYGEIIECRIFQQITDTRIY